MAAQQVGSLYLEVFLDPTQYYAQIQAVEKRAREMATRIEREWKQAPLRPRVDDRELTDLNRHLDLKRRHYSEVRNYIESNPIKLKVDSSQLKKIDVPVSKSVKIDVSYRVSGAIPQIKDSKIKVDIQFDAKNLKSFASVVGDELEDVGKNIVKGIKKATNKGAIGGIFQGFYEGIGNTYAETLTRGAIKGIEGKFGVSIRNLGKQSSETVIGGGNTLLKKLGISDAKKSVDSANQVFKDLFPADIIEKKLDRVETRFNKFFDSLTKFKSAQENLSNLGAIGQELGSFGQIPFEKLKADRKKKIEEIAQQIKQEQKQNPIKVNIPSEAERMVFATSGFAGAKGKSGNWVASKLQMLLGNKSAVIPIENPHTDVSASIGDVGPLRWSAEATHKTLKTPIKHKVNPDAVSMARQAYAAHLENPTLPVRLAGYSFGGQTANDSLEILKALGVKDVKALGIGSPSFGKLSGTSRSEFQAILGKGDGVKRLQDIGAFFAGQGKNLNITPVQGHELSSYLADPKSQEIILKQIEGDKARVRKEMQNPDVFRLVDYKKNIEQMLSGVESLLTSPVSDPNLQKNLMGANLQGIEETRQELDKMLGTLSKEITQNFDEHYQALVEAENILRDLLGANSQPQPKMTQQAQKNNESAKQILAMQSKRAILEPLGTEFGIKGARKLKKDELINNLADKVPLDILKQKLPYTVDPGQEVLQSVAKRQNLDTNSLKLVSEQSLKSIKERSGKSLRGSQLIDLSSDIEREYQIVLGLLAKNISEDSKKVLESAKMLLGKSRASAIRNAVAEVGERNQPKQQIDQSIRQGLARVSNKDVFEPIKRLKETSQEQLKQNYLKIAEALSAAQEVKFDPKQLPELVIDESALRNMGADAFYDTNKNQILITKAIEQALKEKPKQLARQSEVLKTLAHELRHAYQSDFGNIPLADLIKGKSAIPLTPRNQAPKSALDAARYNVKMLHRDNPKMGIAERMGIERLEVDAYASEKYARFASKALQTSGQDVRQTRQEAIDDTLKNVAQAIEDFANRIDEMAPVLRSSFERLTKDATTNFNKLFASIKHFIHMQINPLPKTVLNREGMARVNPLKRPDEAFAFMGDIANYAKVLEFNARTMPAGSKETSRQRFTNRILPRNVRRQMAQGGQALEEVFNLASESIPEIIKNPVVNRVLEYKLKFEIKGWSDVLEMLYKDVDKLFQGIENKAGESKYFGEFLQQIVGGMKNLNLTTIATGVAFFRFFSMLKYTGYLVALGTAVLATATAFEALNRRFTLTAQSSIKAQASLSNLMQSAKDLRLSRDALLTGGADIQASLRSRISDQTQIDKILQSAATSTRIYGTNPQDTQQILGGFANLAAEPTLSQSSFQQLQTTVPDIYSVAARAAGTSEQGFMQGLQRGEYTTSEFLPVLSQQLNAENSTKTASAIDTMSAATQRMANATEELQLAFSDFAIPFSKFTTNAFAQALEMAVKGAQLFASALTGLAFWSIYKFGKALVVLGGNVLNIASKIPLVGTAMLAMARIAQQVAANILPIIGKMAKEFILFQIIVDVFTIVSTAMKDSSGEIGRAADNITKNLNKFQEALRKTKQDAKLFSQELPKSFQEVKGKSYLEDTFFGGLLGKENARAIEDFDTRRRTIIDRGLTERQKKRLEQINPELVKPSAISRSEKEVIDRGKRVDQITAASSQINTAIQSQLTGDSELKQLSSLDKQLASIQNRRRAMAVVDPTNRKGFNELKQQEEELLKLRQQVSTPVEALSGASTSVAQGLQEALTEYERLASERLITQDEYTKRTTEIKTALEIAEKSQEDFNKQMRNAITPLQAFERAWIRITGALESSRNAIILTANAAKQKLAEQEIQGIATPGIASQTTSAIELESLRKQAQATRETIAQMYAEMESRDSKEIFGALGVNKGTSGLEVRALAERSEGFPMQKALLEKLAETKDLELNLSELDTQIAQARANAQKTLVDLNKQVADYYRGISRNAQQQNIEMQRLSYQVQVTQQQNKLRSALLDGYDTIVSQFIDSIIDSIGQFNQVGDRALEAQSQLLTNRFNLEDTLRSGVELSRNLPTVPIKLDFSGIPADNNIVELGRQVQEAIDGSNDLGESINGATSNADDLYKQLIENLKPLDDANKNLTDTASNFDSVNQKAQESGDLAKQFGGELGAIPSQVANIDQGFVGIVTSLGTIIAKTVEWLTNLGGAKESIEGIANNMGKHPFVQGIQQIGQGILQAGSYGIASPSTTQSLEQVLKGSVSQGQGFFGQRARGNHASIDFDGTEGLGGGAVFQAMFPGRVASTRAWGNGYRDVDGGNSNAIRIISKLPGGLGEFSTDYGHYKASTAKVQEGQDILAGTKLGTLSQKDSISSGGHLDLKIRIPSTIANQFKTTQSTGGGQSFVEVKEFMRWYQGQLGSASKQQTLPMTGASNIQSSAPQGGISRGGNPLSPSELARLTKEGQQLYQLQRNPNILAFADVVARAEGTDFRNNSKNFGYSMMIGGEHNADFSRHPFAGNSGSRIRAPRHNSTASGRYQMMDFNYSRTQAERQFGRGAKSDLASVFKGENPGSFSPGVQDLYFTASLKSRGILDEVLAGDFEAALKNPNIAKHYASLQSGAGRSAYKGQGTPEGQLKNTIPFAHQRLQARRREGAPVSVAADNFSAATPGQLRNGVLQGMNLAVQTAQQGGQRETLITKQSEADQERARQEAVRKANQALRQYKRARRDQEDRSITNQRGVTDFGISAIKNPSPAQRRLQESTQIKRQSDDLIKEREREIENRQKQIEQSQEILRNKSYLAAPNAAEVETQLKQGIKENEKEIPRLAKQIDEIKKIGADYQKNVEAIFAREDNQRRQTADFEAFQGEIAKSQKQLEGLQQLQQVSPLDERVFDIPALQEEIELKQTALDLDKAIFDEKNKLYSHSINQQEYDRRIEQIKQENIVRQENAMARRQQAEAEQELQKVQRQLEVRAQATSMNNEYLQNMMQLRQLGKGGRNPLDIQREMNLAQMDSDFAQREFEINRNRNRTPEERERELESLRQIRQSRTDVINAELARNQEDNQIAARDLFNKSNLDIVGAQASNMRVFGQDNRARQLEKGMAVFQQQTAFQDQIRELERLAQTNEDVAKSADLIRANYEELNKIKLDEIKNQFNEFLPAIQEIKGATQGLFSDLLSGADDAFANFGKKILDYFTQLAAQMLTNDLFGAIGGAFGMKGQQSGGGGGQIFDLLGGLLGGLFYNGGYVPNYAKGYNPLQDALKREHAQTGKRAYVAVLSEGERVLNIDETRKFHAMGGDNILRFAEGGMVGATSSFSPGNGGNVSVNNNIVIGGNSENTDVGAFRTVLDGRIREIIREEQRPGRSLNRKRR